MKALRRLAEAMGGAWTSSPGSRFAPRAHTPVQDAEEGMIPPGLAALDRHPDRRRILGEIPHDSGNARETAISLVRMTSPPWCSSPSGTNPFSAGK